MTQIDERILEFLNLEVKDTPQEMANSGYATEDNSYIPQRLKVPLGGELVQKTGRGLYQITPKGRSYLSGDAHLRDEPKPE